MTSLVLATIWSGGGALLDTGLNPQLRVPGRFDRRCGTVKLGVGSPWDGLPTSRQSGTQFHNAQSSLLFIDALLPPSLHATLALQTLHTQSLQLHDSAAQSAQLSPHLVNGLSCVSENSSRRSGRRGRRPRKQTQAKHKTHAHDCLATGSVISGHWQSTHSHTSPHLLMNSDVSAKTVADAQGDEHERTRATLTRSGAWESAG
jgi:hypothetical protein